MVAGVWPKTTAKMNRIKLTSAGKVTTTDPLAPLKQKGKGARWITMLKLRLHQRHALLNCTRWVPTTEIAVEGKKKKEKKTSLVYNT